MMNLRRIIRESIDKVLQEKKSNSNSRWEVVQGYPSEEIDEKDVPKELVTKAYKLVKVNPRSKERCVYPLYVNTNSENKERWAIGKWYKAGEGEHYIEYNTNTNQPTGKIQVKSKLGNLAYRPGLHCGSLPYSPHIYAQKDNFFDDDIDGWVKKKGEPTVYGKTAAYYKSLSKNDKAKFKKNFDPSQTRSLPLHTAWAECLVTYSEDDQAEAKKNGDRIRNGKVVNNAKDSMLKKLPKYGYKYKTNSNAPDNQTWYISNMMKIVRIIPDEEVRSILNKEGIKALDRSKTDLIDLSFLTEMN